jgi:histidinol-phosphate/aromatic aminotransferase/cobyric acid decarboxylase-like protein
VKLVKVIDNLEILEKEIKINEVIYLTNPTTPLGKYFDFNSFENWLDMENMIYVGMRYGVSSFSQTLNF